LVECDFLLYIFLPIAILYFLGTKKHVLVKDIIVEKADGQCQEIDRIILESISKSTTNYIIK